MEGQQLPVRILHMIGNLDLGGSQSLVLNLYKAMDRDKFQFDFILDHHDKQELVPTVRQMGARIFFMPRFVGNNIVQVLRAWDSFFVEHPEYRILHSHVRSYSSLFLPIAKRHGVKTIIHSHNTTNGPGILALSKNFLQFFLRYEADYFIACSPRAGRYLFGGKVTQGQRYHILANGINVNDYKYNPEIRAECRKELALGERRTYIHVGRFCLSKNHRFLLEIFRKIVDREPDAILLLVGGGELLDTISTQIAKLGLAGSVKALGERTDVPRLLQTADCFLFPSLWEGFPVALVEAQAAGLPCLVSDTIEKDIAITDLIDFLPIDRGADLWSDAVGRTKRPRLNYADQIKAAGFDIRTSAKWISALYEQMLRQ